MKYKVGDWFMCLSNRAPCQLVEIYQIYHKEKNRPSTYYYFKYFNKLMAGPVENYEICFYFRELTQEEKIELL